MANPTAGMEVEFAYIQQFRMTAIPGLGFPKDPKRIISGEHIVTKFQQTPSGLYIWFDDGTLDFYRDGYMVRYKPQAEVPEPEEPAEVPDE